MTRQKIYDEMCILLTEANPKSLPNFYKWYDENKNDKNFTRLFEIQYGDFYKSRTGKSATTASQETRTRSNNYYNQNTKYTTEQSVNSIANVILWLGIIGVVVLTIVGIVRLDWNNDGWVYIIIGAANLIWSLVVWAILKMLSNISTTLKSK